MNGFDGGSQAVASLPPCHTSDSIACPTLWGTGAFLFYGNGQTVRANSDHFPDVGKMVGSEGLNEFVFHWLKIRNGLIQFKVLFQTSYTEDTENHRVLGGPSGCLVGFMRRRDSIF